MQTIETTERESNVLKTQLSKLINFINLSRLAKLHIVKCIFFFPFLFCFLYCFLFCFCICLFVCLFPKTRICSMHLKPLQRLSRRPFTTFLKLWITFRKKWILEHNSRDSNAYIIIIMLIYIRKWESVWYVDLSETYQWRRGVALFLLVLRINHKRF